MHFVAINAPRPPSWIRGRGREGERARKGRDRRGGKG